jgi:predicted amidohydrolase
MKQLRVGIIQAKIFYNPTKNYKANDTINYKRALNLLKKFKKNDVDLIVFPEFYPGCDTNKISELKELHEEARRINSFILCGEFQRIGKKMYNSETLISPKGKIVGRYHKIKLWFDEARYGVLPGKTLKIFNIRGVKVGILTCYDMSFTSLFVDMKKMGAEIVVNPSQIVPAFLNIWKYDIVAKVNNYNLPVVGVNCCLYKASNGLYYGGGKSKVVLPSKVKFGKFAKPMNVDKYVTKELGSGEGILKYTIKVK